MAVVKENIDYDFLLGCRNSKLVDGILHLIVETLCSGAGSFRINGTDMDAGIVKARLLRLDQPDIACVLNTEIPEGVRNPKNYLLAMLFNVPVSSEVFWQ